MNLKTLNSGRSDEEEQKKESLPTIINKNNNFHDEIWY